MCTQGAEIELLNVEDASASETPGTETNRCSTVAKLGIVAAVLCSFVAVGIVYGHSVEGPKLAKIISLQATPPTTALDKEYEVLDLVNELRKQGFTCPKGKYFAPNHEPLVFDCRLWKASYLHSQDMADNNYFSHNSQDGTRFTARAQRQGIQAHGENIAAGGEDAADTVEQWKTSDGHCKNMMNRDFTMLGVGYGQGGRYRHYWTQMFKTGLVEEDDSCYPQVPAPDAATPATPAAPVPAPSEAKYIIVTSGSGDCSDHGGPITDEAECKAAAQQLDISDGSSCHSFQCPAFPANCWLYHGSTLVFNKNADSKAACTSQHKCICNGAAAPTATAGTCTDKTFKNGDDWHDDDGPTYDCDWYKQGTRCECHGDGHAQEGLTAKMACCACGGGN